MTISSTDHIVLFPGRVESTDPLIVAVPYVSSDGFFLLDMSKLVIPPLLCDRKIRTLHGEFLCFKTREFLSDFVR
jgi:hypothetical protein